MVEPILSGIHHTGQVAPEHVRLKSKGKPCLKGVAVIIRPQGNCITLAWSPRVYASVCSEGCPLLHPPGGGGNATRLGSGELFMRLPTSRWRGHFTVPNASTEGYIPRKRLLKIPLEAPSVRI